MNFSIILYEKGNKFELLYNGLNTATGTYRIDDDTIQLNVSIRATHMFWVRNFRESV